MVSKNLSTRSRVIPSYQGDSIIFHNDNFLQLQGIDPAVVAWCVYTFLPRPPIPRRLPSLFCCRELYSLFLHFTHGLALIAVPRASPRACKRAGTLLKCKKREYNYQQQKREGSLLGIGGLCKNL